jgi:hypothetical protein
VEIITPFIKTPVLINTGTSWGQQYNFGLLLRIIPAARSDSQQIHFSFAPSISLKYNY